MTAWVLDSSMALAWALPDERSEEAERFMVKTAGDPAAGLWVPALWWYEIANALTNARRRKRLTETDVVRLIELYGQLPLRTDGSLGGDSMWRHQALAAEHDLSAYDAAYLELAQRTGAGLATLDERLRAAAKKAGLVISVLLLGLLALPSVVTAACIVDSSCPYGCARQRAPGYPKYCSAACCVGRRLAADQPEQVCREGDEAAIIGAQGIDFVRYEGDAERVVKVVAFSNTLARPAAPRPDGERLLVCTRTPEFCGVYDVSGRRVFKAPKPPKGGFVEAVALSPDGRDGLFAYGRGKYIEEYLVWSEKAKARRYRNDLKDLELRQVLERFKVPDYIPEP